LEALNLKCPLCGQPVSTTVYQQITGIWKERNKVLSRIKAQQETLQKQMVKFREKKTQLIQKAVDRETKRLKRSFDTIQKQKQRIEEKAAAKLTQERTRHMKKDLQQTMRDRIKDERQRVTERVTTRYTTWNNTLRSTLQQLKTQSKEQNKELKQRGERIGELERQLIKKTTPQIEGLLYEDNLLAELEKNFPEDKFDHTGKGGDVIEHVFCKNQPVGVIVFECKRVKQFSSAHVKQALVAKEKRKGDFAILVTNAMKKGTQGFFAEGGVLVVHATGVMSLARLLRSQITKIAEMKLSQLERESAVKLTLDYLQGPEFANSMESIVGEAINLYQELRDEMKKHISSWKKRYNSYAKIHSEAIVVRQTTKAMMTGEHDYKKLISKSPFPELVELPLMESADNSSKS